MPYASGSGSLSPYFWVYFIRSFVDVRAELFCSKISPCLFKAANLKLNKKSLRQEISPTRSIFFENFSNLMFDWLEF